MAVKLTIYRVIKKEGKLIPYSEPMFPADQDEIRFGRGKEGNDVVLKDERNLTSRHHAILALKAGKLLLTDLNSVNKTFVDGKQVQPNQTIEVTPDTKIEMANFQIQISITDSELFQQFGSQETQETRIKKTTEEPAPEPAEVSPFEWPLEESPMPQEEVLMQQAEVLIQQEEVPEPPAKMPIIPPDVDFDIRKVAEELRFIHKKYAESEPEERKQKLIEFLKQKMKTMDSSRTNDVLKQLMEMFPDQAYSLKALREENEELKKKVGVWVGDTGLPNSSYHALNDLANKLIEEGITFQSEQDINKFCDNIKSTVESFLSSFSDLDKGRKRVLEDFIDIWDQKEYESPLLSKTPKEMIQLLLDWRNNFPEKISQAEILEKSLQILIIHEISLLKGYQEATFRGSLNLLDKLDPKVIAFQIGKRQLNLGFIKIPYSYFPPLVQVLTWREYVKRHQQLRNEDPRTFEALFRPSFAAKYREIINRSKQTSRNLSETRTFYRENLQTIKKDAHK